MTQPRCPHCNGLLQPFELPEEGAWDSTFHLACFDDDCPYYTRGWKWMEQQFGVKCSYRYRLDPVSGEASPIAVWSPTALKSRILDAEVAAEQVSDDASPDASSATGAAQ
jgi:hypothetical protein